MHQVDDLFELNVKLRCQKVKHGCSIQPKNEMKNFAFNMPAFTEGCYCVLFCFLDANANAYSTVVIDLFLEKILTLKHLKNTEGDPIVTYKITGTMALLLLLHGAEALARRESVMNKRPQPQIKFLRTMKRHTEMT